MTNSDFLNPTSPVFAGRGFTLALDIHYFSGSDAGGTSKQNNPPWHLCSAVNRLKKTYSKSDVGRWVFDVHTLIRCTFPWDERMENSIKPDGKLPIE